MTPKPRELPRDRNGNLVPGYVMRIRGRLCCSLHGYFRDRCEECNAAIDAVSDR